MLYYLKNVPLVILFSFFLPNKSLISLTTKYLFLSLHSRFYSLFLSPHTQKHLNLIFTFKYQIKSHYFQRRNWKINLSSLTTVLFLLLLSYRIRGMYESRRRRCCCCCNWEYKNWPIVSLSLSTKKTKEKPFLSLLIQRLIIFDREYVLKKKKKKLKEKHTHTHTL